MENGCTAKSNLNKMVLTSNLDSSLLQFDRSSFLSLMKHFPQAMGVQSPDKRQRNGNNVPRKSEVTSQHSVEWMHYRDDTEYVLGIIKSAEEILYPGEQSGQGLDCSGHDSETSEPLFDLTGLEPTPIGPDAKVVHLGASHNPSTNVALAPITGIPGALQGHQRPTKCDSHTPYTPSNSFVSKSSLETFDSTSTPSCSCQRDKQGRRFRDYEADQWTERFTELLQFKREHGHCLVPHTYPLNPLLSQWVKRQRYQYKLKALGRHSTLTEDRQNMLEMAGFIWHCHQASWYEKLEALQIYRARHGDCRVPPNYHDRSLAVWVKCQRRQWKLFRKGERCSITKERIEVLDKIGFEWNPRGL